MDYLSNKQLSRIPGDARLGPADTQTSPVAERKPSQTETALKDLAGQHARLDALVSELERRISAVLRPCPPSNPGGQERANSSPLADKLFDEAASACTIAERIDSIISRVDL